MPSNPLSLVISGLALIVSITTAWLTLFRRGNLGMTQPVLIGLLYDLPAGEPKLFFRALLYASGKRGHIVEGMYVKVRRSESTQTFNFWMYGETKALLIGSGLRVGEDGVSANHHFLPPKDRTLFQFLPGEYALEVYVKVIYRSSPILLSSVKLVLSPEHASFLQDKNNGVLFIWGPDSQAYHAHTSDSPVPLFQTEDQ